jgi:FAD/FMN-containing dehydrogenase
MVSSALAPKISLSNEVSSWGRLPHAQHAVGGVEWRDEPLVVPEGLTALPHGLGRSYGDSCLNDGGALVLTDRLNRFIAFDRTTGVIRCESGVTLEQISKLTVPQGWFLPVTPGTKFVTLGGAIANDVHGKNHHAAGTFGRWVRAFELVRSDGTRRICTPTENADWFGATIGGLGLTGLVTWAEFQLRPIHNAYIETETIKFGSLDEFYDINEESVRDYEATVSWTDCLIQGKSLGRGHYIRGNHAGPQLSERKIPRQPGMKLAAPFDAPSFAMNKLFVKAFNFAYYHRQLPKRKAGLATIDSFYYPLDGVHRWNRIYGKRGFFQYQLVVPIKDSRAAAQEIFEQVVRSGQASFLNVFKTFGTLESPGWLSFPRPGVTLAVDFANRGQSTLDLFARLDRIVEEAGGAVYPAKDARMSPASFRKFFPAWEKLVPYVDPRISSSFWRRVTSSA